MTEQSTPHPLDGVRVIELGRLAPVVVGYLTIG
jgi:hypothetical protein